MSARRSALFSFLALTLGLFGCDGTPVMPDAGMSDAGADTGPVEVDAGPPLACTDLMRVDAVTDDTVSVMLDTSMTETRPRDLGLSCGNAEAELRWAPQQVLEIHVPGSGLVAVDIDTVFFDTQPDFNTVLQVRSTCEQAPRGIFPPTCFDNVSATEFRSRGAVTANGGDVLYLLVTGYSRPPPEQGTVDRGRVRVDITIRANQPPTITDGYFLLALNDTLIQAVGNDPDADVRGVAMNFYGPTGELMDIYGDGEATLDGDVFFTFFNPAPTTADFTANATVLGSSVTLAGYLRANMASQVALRVFDSGWAASEPLMLDIAEADLAGFGEPCGGRTVCRPEMICATGTTDTCIANSTMAAACGAATPIVVPVPTDMATSATVTGTTGAGVGNIEPSCVTGNGSIGAEKIYSVDVPDGTFDLLATTELTATGTTDTILYVRGACADSGTELDCNDDRAMGDLQSDVTVMDVTMGTYFIFVERYGGLASGTIPHAVQVTLRPVLASGAACDMAGVQNRCATGTCTASLCP